MNTIILKYQLDITDVQNVMLPRGGEILCVQAQGSALCLWAMVNPSEPKHPRGIEIIGTGNPVQTTNRRYVSTVQMYGLAAVWHVFECEPRP